MFAVKEQLRCGDAVEPQYYWIQGSKATGGKIRPGGLETETVCARCYDKDGIVPDAVIEKRG